MPATSTTKNSNTGSWGLCPNLTPLTLATGVAAAGGSIVAYKWGGSILAYLRGESEEVARLNARIADLEKRLANNRDTAGRLLESLPTFDGGDGEEE